MEAVTLPALTFDLTSIEFDRTRSAVSFLAIDGNLNADFVGDRRQLLSGNGAFNLLSVDGDVVVVFGPIFETGILWLSQTVVVFEGVRKTTKKVESSCRGRSGAVRTGNNAKGGNLGNQTQG